MKILQINLRKSVNWQPIQLEAGAVEYADCTSTKG